MDKKKCGGNVDKKCGVIRAIKDLLSAKRVVLNLY